MHGRPLTPLQRASMLVVAVLWLVCGSGLAYVGTLGFAALPRARSLSSLCLMLGVGGVVGAFRFVISALAPHRPYDFEAEIPDANPDLSSDVDDD